MPTFTAYPTDDDLAAFVLGAGVTVPSAFSFAGYAAAAALEWERLTGYTPFLQDTSATARYYDPPGDIQRNRDFQTTFGAGRILSLRAGLQDATAIVSVATPNGNKVVGTDFRLAPQNAAANKMPYSRIEFFNPVWGIPSLIIVTAKWGAQSVLAEDVWQAILRIGAIMAVQDTTQGILLTFNTVKQGDLTMIQNNPQGVGVMWQSFVDRVVRDNKLWWLP